MIDVIAGGALTSKMPEATQELFEEMAMNDYQQCGVNLQQSQVSQLMFIYGCNHSFGSSGGSSK